jgi:ABC-type sugar transport system substrate-binding protein
MINNHDWETMMKIKNVVMACLLGMAAVGAAGMAQAADVRVFVRHEVADYSAWKKAYNGFATMQKKMGVIYQAVYQSIDDPNDVTVIHDFHSLDKAKAFAASPDLKAAMEKSGVKGAPQIWYTTRGAK